MSGDHDQHTDNYSSVDAGYDQHYVSLRLHRVNLVEEMICQFKDKLILKYTLKFSFINERGADADGVARDAFVAFWTEFLDSAAEKSISGGPLNHRFPLLSWGMLMR